VHSLFCAHQYIPLIRELGRLRGLAEAAQAAFMEIARPFTGRALR
jgi:hypothetical protein